MSRKAKQRRAAAALSQAFAYFKGDPETSAKDKPESDTALDQMYAYYG